MFTTPEGVVYRDHGRTVRVGDTAYYFPVSQAERPQGLLGAVAKVAAGVTIVKVYQFFAPAGRGGASQGPAVTELRIPRIAAAIASASMPDGDKHAALRELAAAFAGSVGPVVEMKRPAGCEEALDDTGPGIAETTVREMKAAVAIANK